MRTVWAGPSTPELNQALGDWCGAHLGMPGRLQAPYSTMGVFDDDTLVAVMLYNNYQPDEGVIEIHGAATTPRWLTRAVLREMFAFPFERVGCQLVVMRVSERNQMWNGRGLPRLLRAYGFNAYPIPRLRGRDEGEIIYTLTDDDWRSNGFQRQHVRQEG